MLIYVTIFLNILFLGKTLIAIVVLFNRKKVRIMSVNFFPSKLSFGCKSCNFNSNNNATYPKLKELKYDTVSFTGGGATVADYLQAQVVAASPRLERIATTYLDILESVAFKLRDKGVSFDRTYCELHPVKSPESYTSKVVRSGKFKVPDTIRGTLYCNKLYDLSVLIDGILPEMKKRGYVLADTEMSIRDLIKRGYVPTEDELKDLSKEKIVPDLDIRLADLFDEVTKLPSNLRYSIGKPQKSGYEDIQMRFVRDFDKGENPINHELIVLFGPHYSEAKYNESNRVYGIVRLFNELNMKFSEGSIGSHSQKAKRYVDLINQMFVGKVSQKLFANAKNKDLYDISEEIPIVFSDVDKKMFENYFSGLKDRIISLYKEAKKSAANSVSAQKQLNKEFRQDKALIEKIYRSLKETIEHYNYQSGLKSTKVE